MQKLNSKNDAYDLLYATAPSLALGAAVETGLLWMLAEKPMKGKEIVQALKLPGKRGYYWLQVLEMLGILESEPGGYAPSALAREAFLVTRSQETWKHLVADERERTACISNLPQFLGEPGSLWAAQGLPAPRNYVEKMRNDPARAREFTRMLYELHQPLADCLAERLDVDGVRRLLDVGGGSGVVSMALLRKYPELTAVVVDIETVCLAGREIAEENCFSDRITYHPMDLNHGDLPGNFDLVLKCDMFLFSERLFQQIWQSLNSGGRLILVDHFSPEENVPPSSLLRWSFLDSLNDPEVFIPTEQQVCTLLVQTGFQVSPDRYTLPDRRVILQAKK